MADTQYELFRDLDRHCVAGGVLERDCREAIRRKRACIESELNRDNPLVRDALAGRTTFTAVYDRYSSGFRGLRRLLPMAHDETHNQQLEEFGKIIPNVGHFVRRSIFALDNPFTCALYGIVASLGVSLVWNHAAGNDNEGQAFDSVTALALALGLGAAGFIAGLFAMMKYRTRAPNKIHAREAAVYMDLNYTCHRTLDDEAWAKFVALKTASGCGGETTTPSSDTAGAVATASPPPAKPVTAT